MRKNNGIKKDTKWSFIDWNKNGIPRTYIKAREEEANYLKNDILKIHFKKLFVNGYAPPLIEIRNLRWDFYIAFRKRNFTYEDLLDDLGLKIYKKDWYSAKWVEFDWDVSGFPMTREVALENIKNYLLTKILSQDFRIKYDLTESDAPTRANLKDGGHNDFLAAIYKKGFTYNEIIDNLGFNINRRVKKYNKFNWSSLGTPRTYKKAVSNAAKFLINAILTNEFKKKYDLGEYKAPNSDLCDSRFYGFIQALWRRNISYNDVLKIAGFIPHDQNIFSEVGSAFHWIAELIFLRHSRKFGCFSFYEPYPSRFSENFTNFHCDNTIIIDNNFRNLSQYARNVSKHIKIINVDYFLGTSVKKSIRKSQKGYQDKYKMLILVPINAKKPFSTPFFISYREHVKILDPMSFSLFMGYKSNTHDFFINHVNLAKRATYNYDCRLRIKEIARDCKELIKNRYNYGQKKLEKYLNKIGKKRLLHYNCD